MPGCASPASRSGPDPEAPAMSIAHLARRALQVARPADLSPDDEKLVAGALLPHELRLFSAADRADRCHGVRVARRVRERVGDDARWTRAALLHDAGKCRAALGLMARSAVTAGAIAAPVAAARLEAWGERAESGNRLLDPVRRSLRPAAYLAHGPIAAAWLERHGTEEEVAAWVRVHHRPELWPETPIPDEALGALAECDE